MSSNTTQEELLHEIEGLIANLKRRRRLAAGGAKDRPRRKSAGKKKGGNKKKLENLQKLY